MNKNVIDICKIRSKMIQILFINFPNIKFVEKFFFPRILKSKKLLLFWSISFRERCLVLPDYRA